MRKITALLLTTLFLSPVALAATSMPGTYDQATATVTATGAYGEAVNFTVPDAALQLDAADLKPGGVYTVTIPVTNTTDRAITISATSSVGGSFSGAVDVVAGVSTVALAAGAAGELTFTVTLPATQTIAATAGQTVIITFDLTGTSDYTAP